VSRGVSAALDVQHRGDGVDSAFLDVRRVSANGYQEPNKKPSEGFDIEDRICGAALRTDASFVGLQELLVRANLGKEVLKIV
jgi:hypothetical protein